MIRNFILHGDYVGVKKDIHRGGGIMAEVIEARGREAAALAKASRRATD